MIEHLSCYVVQVLTPSCVEIVGTWSMGCYTDSTIYLESRLSLYCWRKQGRSLHLDLSCAVLIQVMPWDPLTSNIYFIWLYVLVCSATLCVHLLSWCLARWPAHLHFLSGSYPSHVQAFLIGSLILFWWCGSLLINPITAKCCTIKAMALKGRFNLLLLFNCNTGGSWWSILSASPCFLW